MVMISFWVASFYFLNIYLHFNGKNGGERDNDFLVNDVAKVLAFMSFVHKMRSKRCFTEWLIVAKIIYYNLKTNYHIDVLIFQF